MKNYLRKILLILVFAFFVMGIGSHNIFALSVKIDDERVLFDSSTGSPFVDKNNRTLVPLRATLEKFGAIVQWDNSSKIATINYNGSTLNVPINQNYIFKDGKIINNDAPAVIVDNRVFLPIRVVIESLGGNVYWDNVDAAVVINRPSIDMIEITYENGDYYIGDVNEGIPHGKGTIKYADGSKYAGEFYNGLPNGTGQYTSNDGTLYTGGFSEGKQNGSGEILYKNGDYFKGLFEEGKRNGKGEYTKSTGEVITGVWSDDILKGMCTVTYINGDKYTGNILNNVREGYGVMEFNNGDIYDGYWSMDMYNGLGKYTFSDGNYYDGSWKDNKLNGSAVYKNGNGTYTGTWTNGVCIGLDQ